MLVEQSLILRRRWRTWLYQLSSLVRNPLNQGNGSMSEDRKKTTPQAAFIPIGIMFIVIGMNSSRGLIVAGVVFLIAGIAAVTRHRKSQSSGDGLEE